MSLMYSENELRVRDLRQSCIHEYGHAHVALTFGIPTKVVITPDPRGGGEYQYWKAECRMFSQDYTAEQKRLIGLAGQVAEAFAEDRDVPAWLIEQDIYDAAEGEVSDTDAEMFEGFTEADVEETLRIVRMVWPKIERSAEFKFAECLADYPGI